ncbi:MAG TPA: EAL domain-containing protein, partial [Burkholderiales bacterium]|nr:EAL domain-containing protein [Burkholderiales bacterium]
MALHIPRRFAGPGIAIAAFAVALVAAIWVVTLERISHDRAREVADAQQANAAVAIAYEQFTLRSLAAPAADFAERFASFGDALDLGAASTVELVALDGTVVARRSAEAADPQSLKGSMLLEAAAQSPRGSFVVAERTPRYVSYRAVPGRALIIAVSTSLERALLAYRERERDYLRNGWIGSGLVLLLAAGLFVVWLRERSADEQLRELANHIPQAVWIYDLPRRRLRQVSQAFRDISGLAPGPVARAWDEWKALVHPDEAKRVAAAYGELERGAIDVQHRIVRPDGEVRHVHVRGFPVREATGELFRVDGTIEDITARKLAEEQLLHQAHYDSLTELPNRTLCFDRLEHALGQARRRKVHLAVLFIDLDRFKTVNDSLGHAVGDALLREGARRLAGCLRAGDTVARVGGDEFAVVLTDLARPDDARAVAQKMIDAMAAPMQLESHQIYITASAGIAVYPDDGAEGDVLLRNADAAMFTAKDAGRNKVQFYTPAMNERAMESLLIENDLRRAFERSQFELYFQPKENMASGRVAGFEALVRWNHPQRGLLQPGDFVPLLEDSGLIVQVGEWIVRSACGQIRAWQQEGLTVVPVAVNLAMKQFLHHDLIGVIKSAIERFGIEARLLEVEITESDAMKHPEQVVPMLRELKSHGLRIAVDDFGTGYSSLAYLKSLPVDTLKVDRSFVSGLPDNADDAAIARAILAMGHSLGLKIIAEGVETPAQRAFLADLGCDELQGYLCSPPL